MKIETKYLAWPKLHELMGSIVAPRPIAFISTIGPDGTYNAAPFSSASQVCSKPPVICVTFSLRMGQKKDTLKNIEFSHDFVFNLVDEDIIKQVVQASADYPYGVDETKQVGLTVIKSEKVKSPRIAEAKVSLECSFMQKLELVEEYPFGTGIRGIVFGEVVLVHIKDDVWVDGKVDPRRLKTIGRIGPDLYCRTTEIFEMKPSKI